MPQNENDTSNDAASIPHFDYVSIKSPSPPTLTPMTSIYGDMSPNVTDKTSERYDAMKTDKSVMMNGACYISDSDSDIETLEQLAEVCL